MKRLSDQKELTNLKGKVEEIKINWIKKNPTSDANSIGKMKNSRINFRLDQPQELSSTFDRAVADYVNGIIEAPKKKKQEPHKKN